MAKRGRQPSDRSVLMTLTGFHLKVACRSFRVTWFKYYQITVGVKELISVYSFRSVILSACCSHSICFQKYEVGSWRKRTDLVAVARHTRRCWRWVWRVQGRVRCSRSLAQSRRLSAATERQGPPWRSNHALETASRCRRDQPRRRGETSSPEVMYGASLINDLCVTGPKHTHETWQNTAGILKWFG